MIQSEVCYNFSIMDAKDLDFQRIAEGYKRRPFLHKQVIERFRKDVTSEIFLSGLDIGCSAGLSSKALKTICRRCRSVGR